MRTLREVKPGGTAVVRKLHGEGATRRRIMDMGVTKGVEIFVRKVAPWGILWKSTYAAMSFPYAKAMRR